MYNFLSRCHWSLFPKPNQQYTSIISDNGMGQQDDKPLSETMIASFLDAHTRHSAAISLSLWLSLVNKLEVAWSKIDYMRLSFSLCLS